MVEEEGPAALDVHEGGGCLAHRMSSQDEAQPGPPAN